MLCMSAGMSALVIPVTLCLCTFALAPCLAMAVFTTQDACTASQTPSVRLPKRPLHPLQCVQVFVPISGGHLVCHTELGKGGLICCTQTIRDGMNGLYDCTSASVVLFWHFMSAADSCQQSESQFKITGQSTVVFHTTRSCLKQLMGLSMHADWQRSDLQRIISLVTRRNS